MNGAEGCPLNERSRPARVGRTIALRGYASFISIPPLFR